jgi:hypothetical protein
MINIINNINDIINLDNIYNILNVNHKIYNKDKNIYLIIILKNFKRLFI